MTDRKKPTAGFWLTVALVAVLVYMASFGPACWIESRAFYGKILPFYGPVEWAITRSPGGERALLWYARLGSLSAKSWWHLDNKKRLTLGDDLPPRRKLPARR